MRLIVVRHAEPDDSGDLSELGRRQARGLAIEIMAIAGRGFPVEAVYSSPLAACREMAEVIANATGTGPYRTNEAFTGLLTEGDLQTLQEPAWAAVEAMREEHSQDCVLVLVTQELAIRALVCSALAIPLEEIHRFRIDAASMTTLDFRVQPQRRTILAGLNETCHLA